MVVDYLAPKQKPPALTVGKQYDVAGTFAINSPTGFGASDGLLVFDSMTDDKGVVLQSPAKALEEKALKGEAQEQALEAKRAGRDEEEALSRTAAHVAGTSFDLHLGRDRVSDVGDVRRRRSRCSLTTMPFDPTRRIGHWYATTWGRLDHASSTIVGRSRSSGRSASRRIGRSSWCRTIRAWATS